MSTFFFLLFSIAYIYSIYCSVSVVIFSVKYIISKHKPIAYGNIQKTYYTCVALCSTSDLFLPFTKKKKIKYSNILQSNYHLHHDYLYLATSTSSSLLVSKLKLKENVEISICLIYSTSSGSSINYETNGLKSYKILIDTVILFKWPLFNA